MKEQQSLEQMRLPASEREYSEPATHDELLSALELSKTGHSPETALALMAEMLRQLQAGSRSITPYVENWVIHAFAKILEEGCSADQAFGLKVCKGKYERSDTHDRDLVAAAIVVLAIKSGMKWEDAIGEAANKVFEDGLGDKAVQAAYAKYRETLELFPKPYLASLIPK